MFKRCKVVMLTTNEKASIFLDTIIKNVLIFNSTYVNRGVHWKDVQHQNIYITSDDKIEEGDWYISDTNEVKRADNITHKSCKCKKIISTTDTSIKIKSEQAGDNAWYNPLPKPSDSFITKYVEEYNKGKIITDVMVEYEVVYDKNPEFYGSGMFNSSEVKIKINSKDNTITIKKIKDSWSREEVIELLERLIKDCNADESLLYRYDKEYKDLNNWIKENL